MKAIEITIHNFRSVCDVKIALDNFGMLVGANNAGKTTVIDAIRAFYGKGVKFDKDRDFPHKGAKDAESWVEIEFRPSEAELASLKADYATSAGTFRVRNYFYSDEKDNEGKVRTGPYAYVNGIVSNERFYGFKTVGQSKFGEIIYIPAVSKVDEHTKLTGPSALRELINTVLSRVLDGSTAYRSLSEAFSSFEGAIKTEKTDDGYSLETIETDISTELSSWGAGFRLNINPIGIDDLIKGLIGHEILDSTLDRAQAISAYGQGFQRSVIYTLIRVAAKYGAAKTETEKREFSPKMTWILFEEPEAFLHPSQIAALSSDLRAISETPDSQVLLTTHNPMFASQNFEQITAICRLQRQDCETKGFQISATDLSDLFSDNQSQAMEWDSVGEKHHPDDLKSEMEAIKYSLWLDAKRSSAFFADRVLLVEGPSETALISYMRERGLLDCKGLFVMDTMGKFNLHRFMKLFQKLGIKHYILHDDDGGSRPHVDEAIRNARNYLTGGIDWFEKDLESFLDIRPAGRKDRKPQHVMYTVINEGVDLGPLAAKINRLLSR